MRQRISGLLPEDASDCLVKAAKEAQNIRDPAMRASRIDLAIYYVRTQYPQYFKEQQACQS
jgi:hypothetical protein